MAYYRLKFFLSFFRWSDNLLLMKTELLDYSLPRELIAQQPCRTRSKSRLLVLDRLSGELGDYIFSDIGQFLSAGDCLVLNDTKVLPARFFARRSTGGELEGLFLQQAESNVWEVMLKGTRRVKTKEQIYLENKKGSRTIEAVLLEKKQDGKCLLSVKSSQKAEAILKKVGFPPLPPYIRRGKNLNQAHTDRRRYQTVFAKKSGAVAAPTAGLHFTKKLIEKLKNEGIIFAYITLHVSAGTFKPVAAENLDEHKIHKEKFSIDSENAEIINSAKERGGRIIAVGTTCVRALETVSAGLKVRPFSGTTDLFIRPGYKFKVTDAMVTNFHLPRSTLLALTAAFASLDNILAAYRHAIEKHYRFYSYGDAMLII
jgi:S-adenosylmethionine:tRNA ribosyltransferase-isomerase